MKKRFIITIGRQYGSGGRSIGKQLAKELGIAYYDKEIFAEAAQHSGLSREYFEKADEKIPGTFTNALSYFFGYGSPLSSESIFQVQSETIQKIASERACVIVGRCADYILRDEPNMVSIFIHAPMETRIEAVTKYEKTDPKTARDNIERITKSRAAFYNFYTNKVWGDAASYNLSIDSSALGIEESTQFIKEFVTRKLK